METFRVYYGNQNCFYADFNSVEEAEKFRQEQGGGAIVALDLETGSESHHW